MADTSPLSALVALTNRPVVTGTPVSSSDHEAWRNDLEARIDAIHASLLRMEVHRADAAAPTDNAREGSIWFDTTLDPGIWKGDPDGSGADTPFVMADTNLRFKTIEIGDWDMDATASVSVAHGLTQANIRSMSAWIRNDDASIVSDINLLNSAETGASGCSASPTTAVIYRGAGGPFDGTTYNSTSYNRGWIVIGYVVA